MNGTSSLNKEASVRCSRYDPMGKSAGQAMVRSPVSPCAITLRSATIFHLSGNVTASRNSVRDGLPRLHHDRPIQKTVRGPDRQGVKDDLERRRLRHVPVALTVDKFGLNPEFGSFGEKVHSARCLHATMRGVAKFSRCRKRIAVFNSGPVPGFPPEPMVLRGFVYMSGTSPFLQMKWDAVFMSVASP